MHGKQGLILYLKQWASTHGMLASHCYQLARQGGLTDREIREAVRLGLAQRDERQRLAAHRRAA